MEQDSLHGNGMSSQEMK